MGQPTLFSAREQQVIDLLLLGKSNKQIALALGVSVRAVEFHLSNIYSKLEVTSRTGEQIVSWGLGLLIVTSVFCIGSVYQMTKERSLAKEPDFDPAHIPTNTLLVPIETSTPSPDNTGIKRSLVPLQSYKDEFAPGFGGNERRVPDVVVNDRIIF